MWKDVVGFEEYFQVNETGEVYSKRSNKILVQSTHKKSGYKVLSSRIGGRRGKAICLKVHRMVAEAFIENPDNKPFVNHIDGIKVNNDISNLEWVTAKENMKHAADNDLLYNPRGEEHITSKLTDDMVREIRIKKSTSTFKELADMYGVSPSAIKNVIYKKGWTHV